MAADLKPGLRVIHPKHGPGTITAVSADAVNVEHDDQDTVRRYVLALCTLTTEAGEPLAKPAPPPPVEHPPTDHITRARALTRKSLPDTSGADVARSIVEPGTAVKPSQETNPMPADILLSNMAAACRERGAEGKSQLADACGVLPHSLKNWLRAGRIPDHHRDAVRAWIDAPHARPAAKPKTPPPARPAAAPPVRRIAKPIPAPAQRLDAPALLAALGFTLTDAWLPDGATMRLVRVAVLPA
jgi:hypothetical protein